MPPSAAANEIKRVADFGVEIGGPLVKDKLWFWGAAAKNDIKNIVITGIPGQHPVDRLQRQTRLAGQSSESPEFPVLQRRQAQAGSQRRLTRPA